jgi:hypothetical protein
VPPRTLTNERRRIRTQVSAALMRPTIRRHLCSARRRSVLAYEALISCAISVVWEFEMAVTPSIDAPYIERGQCTHARWAHPCATVPRSEPGADG